MQAQDVMERGFTAATVGQPMASLIELFRASPWRDLPVVGRDRQFMGMVTWDDFFQALFPDTVSFLDKLHYLERCLNPGTISGRVQRITAGEIMRRDIVTVTPETGLGKLVAMLMEERVKQLPIVQNEKLLGIVARYDLLGVVTGHLKDMHTNR